MSRRTGIDRPGAAADTSYTYEPDSDLASLNHAFVAGSGPGAVSFSYGHDAGGKTTTIGISQPAFEWLPSLSYARSYGVANELNQIGSAGGIGIGWNADGNMTSDGVNTYSWGYGNRMIGASRKGMTAAYDYDSDDRRTKKTVNGVVTRTLWSGADELAEYDGNGDLIRRFVPDGTGAMDARLATVTPAGAVYWHHVDHQGTVIATSDRGVRGGDLRAAAAQPVRLHRAAVRRGDGAVSVPGAVLFAEAWAVPVDGPDRDEG
jgi:YD repeat-containing protein